MRGLTVYPDNTGIEFVTKQSKYTLPKGTPVGIDPVTDKFIPVIKTGTQFVLEDAGMAMWNPAPGIAYFPNACFVDTNKIVVTFITAATNVYFIAGDYDPATGLFSWGTPVDSGLTAAVTSGAASPMSICKIDTNKFACAWGSATNPYVIVGSVSGNVISLGSGYSLIAEKAISVEVVCIDTNKIMCVYASKTSVDYDSLFGRCGTVSGNAVTLGIQKAIYASAPNVVICVAMCKTYTDEFAVTCLASGYSTVVYAGSVSGTTISVGSPETLTAYYGAVSGIQSEGNNRKFIVGYGVTNLTYGYSLCSISSNVITVVNSNSTNLYNGIMGSFYSTNPLHRIAPNTYIGGGYYKVTTDDDVVTIAVERPTVVTGVYGYQKHIYYKDDVFFVFGMEGKINRNNMLDIPLSLAATESMTVKYVGVLDNPVDVDGLVRAIVSGIIDDVPANANVPSYVVQVAATIPYVESLSICTGVVLPAYKYLSTTSIKCVK